MPWGHAPAEIVALLLVTLVGALGFGLLFFSSASHGATLLPGVLVAVGTYRTVQVTREGQVTDRITDAVKQLATRRSQDGPDQIKDTPDEVVVLGGIYALERIARDSRADYGPIMEILTAYIRQRPRCQDDPNEIPNDVQAVLAVLGRRSRHRVELRLDLRSTDLPNAKLPWARLSKAILIGTNLRGADLRKADLRKADLREATLIGAKLCSANLRGADLRDADFRKGDRLTDLQGADLRGRICGGRTCTARSCMVRTCAARSCTAAISTAH
jgi:pentapeptide repeat protein